MAYLQFGVNIKTIATSSTPKTVVLLKAPTNQAVKLVGTNIGCDGTNSALGPAIIEVCSGTYAGTGTAGATVTPAALDSGRPETIQTIGRSNYSSEPTVLTAQETFYVPSYMGSAIIFRPLTVPIIVKGAYTGSLRVTQQSGSSPNTSGVLVAEE